VMVASRSKVSFRTDGSTSPENYGWLFVMWVREACDWIALVKHGVPSIILKQGMFSVVDPLPASLWSNSFLTRLTTRALMVHGNCAIHHCLNLPWTFIKMW
jgi:hypothetical protein